MGRGYVPPGPRGLDRVPLVRTDNISGPGSSSDAPEIGERGHNVLFESGK